MVYVYRRRTDNKTKTMKHIHFFGCSQTAGDELSDAEFFPWKELCKTKEEYYIRRGSELGATGAEQVYMDSNRTKAYPAKIANESTVTYNHAKNGASVREMILIALRLEREGAYENKLDAVYFQLPPGSRELYILDDKANSLQLTSVGIENFSEIDKYISSKIASHNPAQHVIEDFMDLILLKKYYQTKQVPFFVLQLGAHYDYRIEDLQQYAPLHTFIQSMFEDEVELIDLKHLVGEHELFGGHYSEFAHSLIADRLKKHIDSY